MTNLIQKRLFRVQKMTNQKNSVGKERIVFELNAHVVKPNIKDISDSAEVMEGAFKSVIESNLI